MQKGKGWKYYKLGPFLQRSGFSEEFYKVRVRVGVGVGVT